MFGAWAPFSDAAGQAGDSLTVDSQLVLYVTIGVTVFVSVAMAVPKITGPLAQAWEQHVVSMRRTNTVRTDADIQDLQRQVKHLSVQVAQLREDGWRHDQALSAHAEWDAIVRARAAEVGLALPPQPPLWAPKC